MIRNYHPGDKGKLIDIFKLNVPKFFDEKEISDFEKYLDNNLDTYLIIEQNNYIVGGFGYYIDNEDGSGKITWIFLHPEKAGRGLGTQAIEYCLSKLRENKSVKKLVVRTSQFSYKFFEKFGYTLVRTEKDYWGQGLDLYLMEQ
ncbi:MAG: GNAT family N-acetyltransferase [Bacteroidales bacterium]|nr:GNAT family N-acetyltransferase [Bacteroidales bacterium]